MPTNTPGNVRILGTLGSSDGQGVVRMEDRVEAVVEDLWSALTEPTRLAGWLGEIEGDLRPGGEFRARFYASGWEGTGHVEACEPPRRLLVLTKGTDSADEGPIEVTLAPDDGATILVWEQRGLPLDLIAAYGAGIQVHVEDLEDHVAGRQRREADDRFEALFAAYEHVAPEIES